ncbi:hypothetical protein E0198_005102 [Clavispora lusitaniae]|nr:hypothetical protein E0198_005102 [Clavispora lusitaniae]
MPPKKNVKKMDLGAFLADDSIGGSWADEEVDMSSIGVATASAVPTGSYSREESEDYPRRERTEYPVPDAPPYKARVANLPYDASEDALARFFEDRLQARDIVEDVKLPMDMMSGRPKGFAFVTFTEREVLEEALRLTMSDFSGRKIYVNVAAPQKADVFDMDWRANRTGPIGGGRREEPDLDWGAARSSGPRERKPRREEPDLDWGSARGSGVLPPRERRPRRDEPDLDWSSARGSGKDEKEFDWKRGQALEPRAKKAAPKTAEKEKDQPKPQKSLYDVLSLDDDSEEEKEEEKKEEPAEKTETRSRGNRVSRI